MYGRLLLPIVQSLRGNFLTDNDEIMTRFFGKISLFEKQPPMDIIDEGLYGHRYIS